VSGDGAQGSGEEYAMGAGGQALGASYGGAQVPIAMSLAMTQPGITDSSKGRRGRYKAHDLGFRENKTKSREHAASWERRFRV
jgi:hypothetical protein